MSLKCSRFLRGPIPLHGLRAVDVSGGLRDIEVCLRAQRSQLYHFGIRSTVARHTLAHANAVRDRCIYADFAQSLIGIARRLSLQESNRPTVSNWPSLFHQWLDIQGFSRHK